MKSMKNYKLYIDDNPLAIDLESALAKMTEQRRTKVLAFKHEQGRKLSAAAYMLLCLLYLLSTISGLSDLLIKILGPVKISYCS